MKLAALVGSVILALSLLIGTPHAQTVGQQQPWPGTNAAAPMFDLVLTNQAFAKTTNLSGNITLLYPGVGTNVLPQPVPGVYQSYPYSSIVVVPGPGPDDRMVRPLNSDVVPNMRIITPELRLVPLNSPKR